ncbi:type 2 lanthipeptide synthetase LanM family protein [Streptomyces sp. cg36]|uniref:type 2 lanthipeptide synthetase LanM family protein n=1 Tax=Streptomyces sp. cg36 TaxID=3238798 RepID=UPI0034E1D132
MPGETTPLAAPAAQAPPLPRERDGRPPLTGSWWARGLWLRERLAAAGAPRPAPPGSDLAARARRRMDRWRACGTAVGAEDTAALSCTAFATTPQRLEALLAEPTAALAARADEPAWARLAERLVTRKRPPAHVPLPADADRWFRGFATVLQPFVDEAVTRLTTSPGFAAASAVADTDAVVRSLVTGLRAQLVQSAGRTLVLELNVARLCDRLRGDTAEERFESFVALYRDPARLAGLLDEYAVLTRLLTTATTHTAIAYAEFLRRFAEDRPRLVAELLGGVDPGPLTEAVMGGGDAHEAGRSVVLLRFASGARLVYKPRPLAVHAHFNDLLDWYRSVLPGADLRRLAVLDRGAYGWMEFVAPAPCADRAGAARFFHRQGMLLALLYAVSATDFHFENVIAAGDQPVAVDLESLFHAELAPRTGSALADEDPGQRLLNRSVQRVGLLPNVVVGPGGALDIGGMGADKGSALPFKDAAWEAEGTDRMRLTRTARAFDGSRNRPTLDGRDLDPAQHLDGLRTGFRDGYRAILTHRQELLAPGGPLDRFKDDTVRAIVRSTRTYAQLLAESSHPDVGRDALDRDRLLSFLAASCAEDPLRLALVPHELADLWAGDIPLFRCAVGSRDLRTHRGAVLPGALPRSGLDRARETIAAMSVRDLADQDWIIQAAFAARTAPAVPAPAPATASGRNRPAEPPRRRALRQARAVAAELGRRAHQHGGRVGWLGLDLRQDVWQVAALRDDLYSGYPGIALFFAQLARVTGEQEYADTARRVLALFPAHLDHLLTLPYRRGWGAFGGLAGTAYALSSAATLLADPHLAAPVPALLAKAAEDIGEDTALDLVSGAAGCLAVAETLVARFGRPADLLARRCAALLVDRAEDQGPDAVAWRTPPRSSAPLLGASHGAGGIGFALLRHAARTGDPAAARTGRAALTHEDAQYDTALGNWPDFRVLEPRAWVAPAPAGAVPHMHAWCHGAPGVGLLRAALPAATRTAADRETLRRAVGSTARAGSVGNDSLCHGDLGNTELFAAAVAAGLPEAQRPLDTWHAGALDRIERYGPGCGTPGRLPTPGLLCGLAGIGHGLLRIAAPDRVASVLLLEEQG